MITTPAVTTMETQRQYWSPELPWHPATSPRVLIVEDDVDVREGWSVFLRHQGYEVLSVGDGIRGIGAIETESPDVVVLDLGLPGMHGFKILHEMRVRGLWTPVVVVTASSSVETDLRARSQGADIVLAKPVNPYSLVPVLEELLGG